MMVGSKLYVSKSVYCVLCPEGQRLHNDWLKAIFDHEEPRVIYKKMQAYFAHRNGIVTKNYSKKEANYCPDCSSWMMEREA